MLPIQQPKSSGPFDDPCIADDIKNEMSSLLMTPHTNLNFPCLWMIPSLEKARNLCIADIFSQIERYHSKTPNLLAIDFIKDPNLADEQLKIMSEKTVKVFQTLWEATGKTSPICFESYKNMLESVRIKDTLTVWTEVAAQSGVAKPKGDLKSLITNDPQAFSNWINLNAVALQKLTDLRLNFLNLHYLPPEIGMLTALRRLDLDQNQFTSLPKEIGNLTALEHLDLSSNELTNLPPEIGNLTGLQWLQLQCNQLLTSLPSEIRNLTALKVLNLPQNHLTNLPPEIGSLAELEVLQIKENPFTKVNT